ncbi:putative hydrophobins [Lyophyllum shimeji]|uniref:Hydrophobin n=1 Tax=Lyophyllum shimeji TaxID=47721 RepID=A0A9P3PSA1_LYOSH|nr:putative hydrophobins [Lyophyllum shimeji]
MTPPKEVNVDEGGRIVQGWVGRMLVVFRFWESEEVAGILLVLRGALSPADSWFWEGGKVLLQCLTRTTRSEGTSGAIGGRPIKARRSAIRLQLDDAPLHCTMFARAAAAFLLTLPLLAIAGGHPTNQCNAGELQCCNSVQDAKSKDIAGLLSVLGLVAQAVTGQVGVTCNPISGIAIGGNSCTAQPVCCTNNSFNGVVALGCTAVNVNL